MGSLYWYNGSHDVGERGKVVLVLLCPSGRSQTTSVCRPDRNNVFPKKDNSAILQLESTGLKNFACEHI